MAARIDWTKADIKYIVRNYEKGTSMDTIAAEYGVSSATIRRVLDENGVAIRPQGRTSRQ